MTITNNNTFSVTDSATQSGSATATVMPAVGAGTGGRGRLSHPTLGVYDYANTPDETVNFDGDAMLTVVNGPQWLYSPTLGAGVATRWDAVLRDRVVIERWAQGEVGAPIALLRNLYAMFANPPNPETPLYVSWYPNYATSQGWYVILQALRAGGDSITLDRRLLSYGYTPLPVELELRIVSAI